MTKTRNDSPSNAATKTGTARNGIPLKLLYHALEEHLHLDSGLFALTLHVFVVAHLPESPQLVMTETPKTGIDIWRATITSGTVDMPAIAADIL